MAALFIVCAGVVPVGQLRTCIIGVTLAVLLYSVVMPLLSWDLCVSSAFGAGAGYSILVAERDYGGLSIACVAKEIQLRRFRRRKQKVGKDLAV